MKKKMICPHCKTELIFMPNLPEGYNSWICPNDRCCYRKAEEKISEYERIISGKKKEMR